MSKNNRPGHRLGAYPAHAHPINRKTNRRAMRESRQVATAQVKTLAREFPGARVGIIFTRGGTKAIAFAVMRYALFEPRPDAVEIIARVRAGDTCSLIDAQSVTSFFAAPNVARIRVEPV